MEQDRAEWLLRFAEAFAAGADLGDAIRAADDGAADRLVLVLELKARERQVMTRAGLTDKATNMLMRRRFGHLLRDVQIETEEVQQPEPGNHVRIAAPRHRIALPS